MKEEQFDAAFAALAHPTRRAIIARLARGEATVTELAAPFAMSQPAISKHLKVLERAGRLETAPLKKAARWIDAYRHLWEDSFDRLDAHLKARATAMKGKRRAGHRSLKKS
jgi:DNA-binding transcriptional ArsR family regulator